MESEKRTCVTSEPSILKSLSGWGWTLGERLVEAEFVGGEISRIDDLLDRDRS